MTVHDPWCLRGRDALKGDQPCVRSVDADEDGPWGKRCVTHGLPWSGAGCEVGARRRRREQFDREQAAVDERAATQRSVQARHGALSELLVVGAVAYSAERRKADGASVGGVVVAIDEHVDRETGEVVRTYVCIDQYTGPGIAIERVTETEVDWDAIGAAAPATLGRLVYRLAEDIAKAGRGRGGVPRTSVDTRVADWARWMIALVRLVGMAA